MRVEAPLRLVKYDAVPTGVERALLLGSDVESVSALGFSNAAFKCAIAENVGGGLLLGVMDQACAFLVAVKQLNFPFPLLAPLANDLFPVTVPFIREQGAVGVLKFLLGNLGQPLLFEALPVNSPLVQMLSQNGVLTITLSRWERAALKTVGTFDGWLSDNFDQKRRKELKRLRARFSEKGQLVSESLGDGGDLEGFIQDFLLLEDRGWKGGKGTSMLKSPALLKALRNGLQSAHAQGALRFWRIKFDGEPVATLFAVVDHKQATLGKIAYDENWAKFSPGVLVILDATADLFADPSIEFADSNAIPGHPMIERLWRDRLVLVDILVAPTKMSPAYFRLVGAYENFRRDMRQKLKSVYYRVKGERPS